VCVKLIVDTGSDSPPFVQQRPSTAPEAFSSTQPAPETVVKPVHAQSLDKAQTMQPTTTRRPKRRPSALSELLLAASQPSPRRVQHSMSSDNHKHAKGASHHQHDEAQSGEDADDVMMEAISAALETSNTPPAALLPEEAGITSAESKRPLPVQRLRAGKLPHKRLRRHSPRTLARSSARSLAAVPEEKGDENHAESSPGKLRSISSGNAAGEEDKKSAVASRAAGPPATTLTAVEDSDGEDGQGLHGDRLDESNMSSTADLSMDDSLDAEAFQHAVASMFASQNSGAGTAASDIDDSEKPRQQSSITASVPSADDSEAVATATSAQESSTATDSTEGASVGVDESADASGLHAALRAAAQQFVGADSSSGVATQSEEAKGNSIKLSVPGSPGSPGSPGVPRAHGVPGSPGTNEAYDRPTTPPRRSGTGLLQKAADVSWLLDEPAEGKTTTPQRDPPQESVSASEVDRNVSPFLLLSADEVDTLAVPLASPRVSTTPDNAVPAPSPTSTASTNSFENSDDEDGAGSGPLEPALAATSPTHCRSTARRIPSSDTVLRMEEATDPQQHEHVVDTRRNSGSGVTGLEHPDTKEPDSSSPIITPPPAPRRRSTEAPPPIEVSPTPFDVSQSLFSTLRVSSDSGVSRPHPVRANVSQQHSAEDGHNSWDDSSFEDEQESESARQVSSAHVPTEPSARGATRSGEAVTQHGASVVPTARSRTTRVRSPDELPSSRGQAPAPAKLAPFVPASAAVVKLSDFLRPRSPASSIVQGASTEEAESHADPSQAPHAASNTSGEAAPVSERATVSAAAETRYALSESKMGAPVMSSKKRGSGRTVSADVARRRPKLAVKRRTAIGFAPRATEDVKSHGERLKPWSGESTHQTSGASGRLATNPTTRARQSPTPTTARVISAAGRGVTENKRNEQQPTPPQPEPVKIRTVSLTLSPKPLKSGAAASALARNTPVSSSTAAAPPSSRVAAVPAATPLSSRVAAVPATAASSPTVSRSRALFGPDVDAPAPAPAVALVRAGVAKTRVASPEPAVGQRASRSVAAAVTPVGVGATPAARPTRFTPSPTRDTTDVNESGFSDISVLELSPPPARDRTRTPEAQPARSLRASPHAVQPLREPHRVLPVPSMSSDADDQKRCTPRQEVAGVSALPLLSEEKADDGSTESFDQPRGHKREPSITGAVVESPEPVSTPQRQQRKAATYGTAFWDDNSDEDLDIETIDATSPTGEREARTTSPPLRTHDESKSGNAADRIETIGTSAHALDEDGNGKAVVAEMSTQPSTEVAGQVSSHPTLMSLEAVSGWTIQYDQTYERDYYFNVLTGESQWVKPASISHIADDVLKNVADATRREIEAGRASEESTMGRSRSGTGAVDTPSTTTASPKKTKKRGSFMKALFGFRSKGSGASNEVAASTDPATPRATNDAAVSSASVGGTPAGAAAGQSFSNQDNGAGAIPDLVVGWGTSGSVHQHARPRRITSAAQPNPATAQPDGATTPAAPQEAQAKAGAGMSWAATTPEHERSSSIPPPPRSPTTLSGKVRRGWR